MLDCYVKIAAIFGKMENGCDLAAKYLQFYSFQKGKTVSLSYGRMKVIEEILSISGQRIFPVGGEDVGV